MAPGKAKMETVQIGLTYLILLVVSGIWIPAGRSVAWFGAAGNLRFTRMVSGQRGIEGWRRVLPEGVERCSLTERLHFPEFGFGTLPCSCMGRHL